MGMSGGEYVLGVGMSGGAWHIRKVGMSRYVPLDMGPQRWVCPEVNHPSQTWDTMGYGRQAGGTFPTRMLSCVRYIYT